MQSTNNCTEITEKLDAYHDGELSADERAVIDKHLSACPACIARLREIDRVVYTLRNAARPALPSGLSSKLDGLIDNASGSKAGANKAPQQNVLVLRPAIVAPIAVAAVSLALFLAYKLLTPSGAPVTANQPAVPKMEVAQNQPVQAHAVAHQERIAQQQVGETGTAEEAASKHVGAPQPQNLAQAQLESGSHKNAQPAPEKIANTIKQPTLPATAPNAETDTRNNELADLPVNSPSLNDTLGIATDEDGLYDIKM